VGAQGADSNAGAAYVIFGKATGWVTVDIVGFTSDDDFGFIIKGVAGNKDKLGPVRGAGDVNKDGFDDMIVGAGDADHSTTGTLRDRAGAAYVIWGKESGWADVKMEDFVSRYVLRNTVF
jgi:hypothetical protein